ncbi:FAD-binding protein [Candidatus Bathyarchaeota archaeon]|nr:FAD-binding protein [Candidatus Bathyarchaeota archaeon]
MSGLADEVIESDVLVVGSEGAGSRAAIEAAEHGVRVVMVTKGRVGRCGATMLAGADITLDGRSLYEMGFNGNPNDSKEKFFRDIVIQGFYLNDQRLVEVYVQDAPARTKEMIDWGMKVTHSEDRAIETTGMEIVRALGREVKRRDIQIVEDVMVTDLLSKSGRVLGAVGIDVNSGRFLLFKSKAVVLATGGWGRAYPFISGTRELTGDGQAMAYRVGAELANMEMVTFCPNVILWPPIYRGSIFLYILHMSCGDLLNGAGERFLDKYDERIVELATKTEWNKLLLSLFTMREVLDGKGSPHGGVYFSLRGVPWEKVENSLAALIAPGWKFQGTDFSRMMDELRNGGLVEVAPAAHYFEGGIKINEKCETNVPGLYAAGECATGLFGANRVAAATTEMLVEGAVAGRSAAEYAKKASFSEVDERQVKRLRDELFKPLERRDGVKPVELRKHIQKVAYEKIGVVREESGLREALGELEKARKEELPRICTVTKASGYNLEWIEALELRNMVQVLEASAKSALTRRESRGVHYRLDYPNVDNDNWLKEIVVRNVGGEMQVFTYPVAATKITPPSGVMGFEEAILKAIEALES